MTRTNRIAARPAGLRQTLAAACALLVAPTGAPAQSPGLYDLDSYRTFQLTFKQVDWWQQLLANYSSGNDIRADLTVDSKVYRDVGVRFRGTSSYLATRSSQKKSFNITLDAFVPGQELKGHRNLNLSNCFNDPTFTREVVVYQLMRRYLPAPRANYVKLTLNGESWGVYVNVQQPDKKMMRQWFGNDEGNRYRCDPPSPRGRGNSALQYLGSTPAPYRDAYELKSDLGPRSYLDLIATTNALNNTPLGQLRATLPRFLAVDRSLWYVAVNNIFVNLDSYIARGNDYYLYHDERHGTLNALPWDMNESLGGFGNSMSVDQLKRLTPFYQSTNTRSRPMIARLLAVPEWHERYTAHYRTIMEQVFDWNTIGGLIARYQAQIEADVTRDTKKLYPTSYFKLGLTRDLVLNGSFFRTTVPGLEPFVKGRAAHLRGLAELTKPVRTLSELGHEPQRPDATDTVFLTARVTGAVPLGKVTAWYRASGPFVAAEMFDDGKHGDGKPGDDVWGAAVTGFAPGAWVQYYVSATASAASGGGAAFLPRTAAHAPPGFRVRWVTGVSDVQLNEFVARNNNGIKDEASQFEDWLELYNKGSAAVTVSGMYLTDDLANPTKWQIPAGYTMQPGETLLVWCDEDAMDGPLHANFKLAAAGEEIGLFDTDGKTLLDSFEFGPQQADVATGRLLDGGEPWVTFAAPTPRRGNELTGCGARDYSALDSTWHRLTAAITGAPRVGGSVTLNVTGGPPSGVAALFASSGPAHVALAIGPLAVLLDPTGLAGPILVGLDAQGRASSPLAIPTSVGAGQRVYLQLFAIDASGLTASNATEVVFCR